MPECEQLEPRRGFLRSQLSMPSKVAQIIAFLAVLGISASLHRFVYANLKRILLRDYPKAGPRLVRIARVLFIVMDSPFVYLYFRSGMSPAVMDATTWLIYPFAIWQAIMLMWSVILVPFVAWRRTHGFGLGMLQVRWNECREANIDIDEIEAESGLEVVTE